MSTLPLEVSKVEPCSNAQRVKRLVCLVSYVQKYMLKNKPTSFF